MLTGITYSRYDVYLQLAWARNNYSTHATNTWHGIVIVNGLSIFIQLSIIKPGPESSPR